MGYWNDTDFLKKLSPMYVRSVKKQKKYNKPRGVARKILKCSITALQLVYSIIFLCAVSKLKPKQYKAL